MILLLSPFYRYHSTLQMRRLRFQEGPCGKTCFKTQQVEVRHSLKLWWAWGGKFRVFGSL